MGVSASSISQVQAPYPAPPGWAWVRLGDFMRDGISSVDASSAPDATFCLWSVPSYFDGHPDLVVGRDLGSSKRGIVPGDILLAKINPHLNRVWLTGGFDDYPQIASSEWLVINPRAVSRELLKYFLTSPFFLAEFASILTGIGGSLRRVRPNDAKVKRIPIPPVAEQHRIVAKLDELMALCDQLEAAQEEREIRRDGLRTASLHCLTASDGDVATSASDVRFFLDRSPRFITKPEHVATARQTILDLAVRGRLVPPDPRAPWRQTTLGATGQWGSGGTPDKGHPEFYGGDIPWIVIGDLNESVVTETASSLTDLGLRSSSAKMVHAGAILIAMYGASVGNRHCGHAMRNKSGYRSLCPGFRRGRTRLLVAIPPRTARRLGCKRARSGPTQY